MKVTFNREFAEVIGQVNAPLKDIAQAKDGKTFRLLLGDIAPASEQAAENTKTSELPPIMNPAQEVEDKGPLARYSFPSAEMISPQTTRAMPDNYIDDSGSSSVKTPTVLEATRLRAHNAYQGMNYSQRVDQVEELVTSYGNELGVDPSLGMAIAQVESGFNPSAISSDGHYSKGLFQLLDTTGKQQLEKLDIDMEYDPFNPKLNTQLGISYLRYLHDLFTEEKELPNGAKTVPAANSTELEKLAVAAFNAGEGRVSLAQARAKDAGLDPAQYTNIEQYLPEITQRYVKNVTHLKARFGGVDPEYQA
ncbi:MAG: transglycosylase SLT domain-containing protein [Deltaproteobacteria bacterium]|nr:transglycosylase SLT domain-containing protein [Deltaproteobacteria bacterium]